MNSLPWASHARPTGRKQLSGHSEVSGLVMMSIAASVLLWGSTGEPSAKRSIESL